MGAQEDTRNSNNAGKINVAILRDFRENFVNILQTPEHLAIFAEISQIFRLRAGAERPSRHNRRSGERREKDPAPRFVSGLFVLVGSPSLVDAHF